MSRLLRMMLVQRGYMEQAGDGTGGSGGGGTGDDGKAEAEAKAKAEAEAKAKAEEEAKKGGKPSDAEAKLLKEVMEKKTALKDAQEKLTQVNEQLKKFEGIDPEKVRALLKQQADAEQKELEAKGEFEQVKKQMVEAHQAEMTKVAENFKTLQAQNTNLQSTIAELTVGNAFGTSKFIAEEMALTSNKARIVYGSHFEFKDGQIVGYDKPAGSANRTPLVDGKGDPLPFDEAIRKIVDADPDKDQLLKSKLKQGAGSGTLPKGGSPKGNEKDLTAKEKIAKGLEQMASKKK